MISDCSEPLMGSKSWVWIGVAIFLFAGIAAVWLRSQMAYFIFVGIVPLVLIHDFHQQYAVEDIAGPGGCQNQVIR